MDRNVRATFGALIACCIMTAIPFLLVTFPPITDLPQQMAQIRLFIEAIGSPSDTPYKIQWFTPYSLSYVVLGISSLAFGPLNGGRAGMLLICLLWVVAIHVTAFERKRPLSAAILATMFIFNHVMYWGFYSFMMGFPAFLLWLHFIEKYQYKNSFTEFIVITGSACLLYMSHVLWFLAGLIAMFLIGVSSQEARDSIVKRSIFLIPIIVAVFVWYPQFSESSMRTPPLWVHYPWSRLSLSWFSDAAFGGIHGPAESVLTIAALLWVAASIAQNPKGFWCNCDRNLLLLGGVLLITGFVLPDKYMNTIRFGQRWIPPAMILIILAVPNLSINPRLRTIVAASTVAVFIAVTSASWSRFEKIELSGLPEALRQLPEKPSVIGLSYMMESEYVKGRPFIQIFAYAQVEKGGKLNFSFAEFSPCLVIYKEPFRREWTGGLEWFPSRAKESDLLFFDHAIISCKNDCHENLQRHSILRPKTFEGNWRLYKIVRSIESN